MLSIVYSNLMLNYVRKRLFEVLPCRHSVLLDEFAAVGVNFPRMLVQKLLELAYFNPNYSKNRNVNVFFWRAG